MKKFSFLAVLLFMVLVVSACGGGAEEAGISEDGILTVGEVGLFKTNSGDFEIVINSIKHEEGGDGEKSLRGTYVVADATVTSRSTKAVKLEDILPFKIYIDDIVNWNSVSSGKEFSFGSQIAGEIKEGESVTGQVIFDARESETYTIILGGKTNPNKLTWELSASDFE